MSCSSQISMCDKSLGTKLTFAGGHSSLLLRKCAHCHSSAFLVPILLVLTGPELGILPGWSFSLKEISLTPYCINLTQLLSLFA